MTKIVLGWGLLEVLGQRLVALLELALQAVHPLLPSGRHANPEHRKNGNENGVSLTRLIASHGHSEKPGQQQDDRNGIITFHVTL